MKTASVFALICLLITFPTLVQSQELRYTIIGNVLDSLSAQALPHVSILVKEKDVILKNTNSTINGSFKLSDLSIGQYQLVLAYIGYRSKSIFLVNLADSSSVINLGNILLSPTANQLKEVQVIADKSLITYEVDKIIYNVDADPESNNARAIDIIRKAPLLTVDAEDNITLKGSKNYRILINGKPSSLFTRNAKDVLRGMPANAIKSIEIISNPPSKYDAEGVGGVINIITHRKAFEGYNGSVNFSASRPNGYYTGGYLTIIKGKIGSSVYYGYNSNESPNSRTSLYRENYAWNKSIFRQEGRKDYKGNFQYLDGEVSYDIDSLNLLTANYSFNLSHAENIYLNKAYVSDNIHQLIQAYEQHDNSLTEWAGSDIGTDYQKTFKRNKNQLLTLSYKLSTSRGKSSSDFGLSSLLNYTPSTNRTENKSHFGEQTLQADYVHPVKQQTFEFGLKTIFRMNNSEYRYDNYNRETDSYTKNILLSNSFDYFQNIYAAYTSVNLHKDNWGMKLGGRIERTKVKANFKSNGTAAQQDIFNLIPNFIFTRKLKDESNLKLAYTQRIERPNLHYLNPYQNIIDPKNISYGNPDLVPAINHTYDLTYNTFVHEAALIFSLYHSHTNNSIQRYTFTNREAVARTTFDNIGKSRTTGLSVNNNISLQERMDISFSGNLNHIKIKSIIDGMTVENNGLMFDTFGYLNYKFQKGWRLSGNLGYNSAQVLLQGKSADYFYSSFAVNKEFLENNKANVGFHVSNPFQKERKWASEITNANFYQLQESIFLNRWFSLSFNYRFGKLENEINRKKRGINNDDIKKLTEKKEE